MVGVGRSWNTPSDWWLGGQRRTGAASILTQSHGLCTYVQVAVTKWAGWEGEDASASGRGGIQQGEVQRLPLWQDVFAENSATPICSQAHILRLILNRNPYAETGTALIHWAP